MAKKRLDAPANPNQVKDFKKQKNKVGKEAQKPANFTATAFKAKGYFIYNVRTIVMILNLI